MVNKIFWDKVDSFLWRHRRIRNIVGMRNMIRLNNLINGKPIGSLSENQKYYFNKLEGLNTT